MAVTAALGTLLATDVSCGAAPAQPASDAISPNCAIAELGTQRARVSGRDLVRSIERKSENTTAAQALGTDAMFDELRYAASPYG